MINFVPAKCPNCGANLQVDDNLKRIECEFCRTTIIVDEAIQKYKVELKGKVKVSGVQDDDEKLDIVRKHIKFCKYKEAKKIIEDMLKINPYNLDVLKLEIELLDNEKENELKQGNNFILVGDIIDKIKKIKLIDEDKKYNSYTEDLLNKYTKLSLEVERHVKEEDMLVKELNKELNKHSLKKILKLFGSSINMCDFDGIKKWSDIEYFKKYYFQEDGVNPSKWQIAVTDDSVLYSSESLKGKGYSIVWKFKCNKVVSRQEKLKILQEYDKKSLISKIFRK